MLLLTIHLNKQKQMEIKFLVQGHNTFIRPRTELQTFDFEKHEQHISCCNCSNGFNIKGIALNNALKIVRIMQHKELVHKYN